MAVSSTDKDYAARRMSAVTLASARAAEASTTFARLSRDEIVNKLSDTMSARNVTKRPVAPSFPQAMVQRPGVANAGILGLQMAPLSGSRQTGGAVRFSPSGRPDSAADLTSARTRAPETRGAASHPTGAAKGDADAKSAPPARPSRAEAEAGRETGESKERSSAASKTDETEVSKPVQDTDETDEDDAPSREAVASEGLPPSLLALLQPAIAASLASTGTGSSPPAMSPSVKSMEMGEGGDAPKTSEGDAEGIGAAHAGHGKVNLEGGEGRQSETSGKAADHFEGFELPPTASDAVAAPLAAAPSTVTATGAAASAATVSPNTPSAASVPIPLGAVPMAIGLRSLAGTNHFEIRLDPKDLGRIDVALDIDKDNGTVKAHLVVDRAETLALLQRDADTLQQALSQAGLEAGDGSINLSLRSDQSSGRGQEERSPDGDAPTSSASAAPVPESTDSSVVPLRSLRGLGGIDIRI